MKPCRTFHTVVPALFFGVLGVLSLAGCASEQRPSWINQLLADERPTQVVAGPRRLPMLNPKPMPPQAKAPPKQPASPPTMQSDPYGYFEAMEAKKAPLPAAMPVRKPFPGVMEDVPPPGSASQSSMMPPPETVQVPPQMPIAEVPAAMPSAASAPAGEPQSSTWLSRMADDITGTSKPEDAKRHEAEPYPALSSVPETPKTFKNVKAQNEQRMEELQQEHMWAEQQRQALNEGQPLPQAEPKPLLPEAAAPASAQPRELLGHAYDSKIAPSAAAPAVTGDKGQETGEAVSTAQETSSLPPPSILQTTTVLPPSRYSGRTRALQYPAAEY